MQNFVLTPIQAFEAVKLFVAEIYSKTKAGDLGDFLSDLEIWSDGKTADPAAWNDWIKAVKIVIPEYNIEVMINSREAFEAMKCFFSQYCSRTHSPNLLNTLYELENTPTEQVLESSIWQDWNRAVVSQIQKGESP